MHMDFQLDRATVIIIRHGWQHLPELIAVVSYQVRQSNSWMEESKEDLAHGHSAPPRPCIAMDLAQAVRRLVLREERKPSLSWLQLPFLGEEGAASRQEALLAGGGFLRMGKLGTNQV